MSPSVETRTVSANQGVVYMNTYTPTPFLLMRHSTLLPSIHLQFYIPSELHHEECVYKQFTYNQEQMSRAFIHNEVVAQLVNALFFKYINHLNVDRSQYNHYATVFTNVANEYFNKKSVNHRGEMKLYSETNDISCCWKYDNQVNIITHPLWLSNGVSGDYWITTSNQLHPNL
jgi:hypothetical protein